MARKEPRLTVKVSTQADNDLREIWRWNFERYGADHADRYVGGLRRVIGELDRSYLRGESIPTRPTMRYVQVRRKSRGHGHILIYRFDHKKVEVLHVFHTAQDWQTHIAEEES